MSTTVRSAIESSIIDSSRTQANPRGIALASIEAQLAALFAGDQHVADVTATADGLTTGIIPETCGFANVTSASANNIVTLPAPTPGKEVKIHVGANGCEVRTTSPTTIGINGGTGAAAESALAANVTAIFYCVSATAWKAFQQTAAGVLTLTEVAAP